MIDWDVLLSAMALVLVFEGIMPFINPRGWRNTMLQACQLPDGTLRYIGFASMLLGVFLLYLMR